MQRLFLALFTVLAVALSAQAQETLERPEYSNKWNLTVVYNSPFDAQSSELHAFLRSNPGMKGLVKDTNFNEYLADNDLIDRTLWATYIGGVRPAMLLQGRAKKNGTADVVFYANGAGLTLDKKLVDAVRNAIKDYVAHTTTGTSQTWNPRCPEGNCPIRIRRPNVDIAINPPSPPPVIAPLTPTLPPAIPPALLPEEPAEEEPAEEEGGIPVLLLVLVAAAGLYGAYSATESSNSN